MSLEKSTETLQLSRERNHVHHQRVSPFESPCHGHDPDWGVVPNGTIFGRERKVLAFVLLAAFTALSGYENRLVHSSAWADRWLGLFWLSSCVLVLAVLAQIPRIANSPIVRHR